jgi:hypothetical protein
VRRLEVTGRLAKLMGLPLPPQGPLNLVVAGARLVHSRHGEETSDQPLGFVFILPRVKAH